MDALQVEDGDQHLKAPRSPHVSRQDRRRVPNARVLGSFAVAHTRLANRDRADAGHDLAFRKMAVAHDALLARLGLEIGVLCEKLSNLRFDRLGQQRTRAAAQDLCEGIGKGPWLGELDDVTVRHGVSLLHWRSGGVEHHHDTPPYPVMPSPSSGHSSPAAASPIFRSHRKRRCSSLRQYRKQPLLLLANLLLTVAGVLEPRYTLCVDSAFRVRSTLWACCLCCGSDDRSGPLEVWRPTAPLFGSHQGSSVFPKN